MLQISVLGAVAVERDGRRVAVPGGKTSELLARLALEAGTCVRADRLVEDVWAEDALSTRRNTLQSKIAKLRRAFGDPRIIVSGDGGYTLAAERCEVDALAVLRDTAAAAELLDSGDDRGAAELSASALERFSGELLQGAGDWAVPYRARLDEARMALMETKFAAGLRLGGTGEQIGELESAVATYPYQEGLWELLITALYRAGRQADALATYRRVHTLLTDELGLAPGPRLQELERRILVQDSALGIGDHAARALEDHATAGNLPSLSAELVGRESEIAAVSDLLEGRRLVEIVGPGGIGKTAVAIATGRRLAQSAGRAPGGVWLARLEAATTADDVVDTVIAALHVSGGEPALLERLKASAAIVILDNCEHVLDAAAALAVRLLDAAPQLRILCTSQVSLDVDGEVVLELRPLALAEAVELFSHRAVARNRDPPAGDAVLDLCRSLDGLPLAIELAAARTKTLSIEEISRRLEDRFSVLQRPDQPPAGAPSRPEGHDSVELRAALPRRPARPVGAGDLRRWRAAVRGRVRARGARRSRVRGDRRRGTAREPVAGDRRRRRSLPAARQHPRVRARRDGAERADRARPGRSRGLVRGRGRSLHAGRAKRSPGRPPRVRPC